MYLPKPVHHFINMGDKIKLLAFVVVLQIVKFDRHFKRTCVLDTAVLHDTVMNMHQAQHGKRKRLFYHHIHL